MSPDFDRRFDQYVQQAAFLQPSPMAGATGPVLTDANAPLPPSPMLGQMTADDYLREVRPDLVRPNFLRSPTDSVQPGIPPELRTEPFELLQTPMDAPLGFTGPSSVVPAKDKPAATSCRSRTAGASGCRNGIATA